MRLLGVVVCGCGLLASQLWAGAEDRPKIGLVLEGGGALGFAHIGVLEYFEKHQIPVDAIAGTSMGGLVGGLYAAGQTPENIQKLVGGLNWAEILRSQPPFSQLSFRRKEDRLAFPNVLELGWRGGLALPSALNSGQEIDSVLDKTLLPYFDLKSFDELPIPFRCVATDLVSGKEKDFASGSLAAALRATGSIPGLFVPENQNGAVYTDGGSLNNLPVDVVKTMKVDIVIAVYLDEGPPSADFRQSLVGIAGRTISVIIAANELRSIQMTDILLTADVKDFSTADFTKSEQIVPRGFAAAESKHALLDKFSLPDDEWKLYVAQRNSRIRTAVPVPEFIAVEGATAQEENFIKNALAAQVGQPIQVTPLENKLTALSAQGTFDSLRFGVVEKADQPGLGIFVAQKTNGPPFLNFGFSLDGSDTNDVRFGFATRLTLLNAGGFGSEWRTDAEIGEHYRIASEYYHLFTATSHWFVAPHGAADKTRFDFYDNRTRTAEYAVHKAAAGLDLGYALNTKTEIRIGESVVSHEADLKLGTAYTPDYERTYGDSAIRFRYFGQDDSVIPHRGFQTETRADWYSASPLGRAYHAVDSRSSWFVPVTERGSVWVAASGGSAFGARNLGLEAFTLGGPFRLGAYGTNELIGNQYLLFQGGYSYNIANFNPLFGGAVYGLAWVEAGKMWDDPLAPRLPFDGSIAVVAKTGLGPFFLGASGAAAERIKWWFGFGRVF